MPKVYVIGVDGTGALSPRAVACLREASVVLASKRLFEVFQTYAVYPELANKVSVINAVPETFMTLRQASAPVAVIASGDPLFFGIGTRILQEMPDADVELLPALSSVQQAFARVGISWRNAKFISLHGALRREWRVEDLPLLCQRHETLAVLTGGQNTPSSLAEFIPDDSAVHVLSRLGYVDEQRYSGRAVDVRQMSFAEPNVMIIENVDSSAIVFGLREDDFQHEGGLITKDEVRAVILHKLRLPLHGVLWDVGAGSGSVVIEARRMSVALECYAIEKDAGRAGQIRSNVRTLGAGAVDVIEGAAPAALAALPAPDRVFIGGGGEGLTEVLSHTLERMNPGGVLVVATVTFESLDDARRVIQERGLPFEVTGLQVGRSRELQGRHYLKSENQVFLVTTQKEI